MFRKDVRGVAVDEETGVRIDFGWKRDRFEDGDILYEINGGPRYIISCTNYLRRRGFFFRTTLCIEVLIRSVRQEQTVGSTAGPVSAELREHIEMDLLSAARCLGINCDIIA